MRRLLIVLYTLTVAVATYARPYTTVDQVPRPNRNDARNFVSNPDRILDPRTTAQLNRIINGLESEDKAEAAVVVLGSIGDNDIDDFAVRLFEAWGIGKSGADNGLLILFVLDRRKIRFETGYGIEGILPDAVCSRIIRENMIPYFKEGNYNAGLLSGMERAASILREEAVPLPEAEGKDWGVALPLALGGYLLIALVCWLWMRTTVGKVQSNKHLPDNIARYNSLRGERNGMMVLVAVFLPFAALMVLLMTHSAVYALLLLPVPLTVVPAYLYARWCMRRLRRAPIVCDRCGADMHILSEKDEDAHLSLSQQFEEQLSAVDYDVFLCDRCHNTIIHTLDKPGSYMPCPRCGTKAFIQVSRHTLVAPTYLSTGVEQTTYRCKFCGYEEHKNTRLPRLQRTNGAAFAGGMAAGSILRGGGSGFGGGGSFGGGVSGGGGATGSW